MIPSSQLVIALGCAAALATTSASAQDTLAPREVPGRSIPVPLHVSPQMQRIIAMPMRANGDVLPKSGDEWKAIAAAGAAASVRFLPGLRARMNVKVEPTTIDGVKAYIVTPSVIPPENRNRLLIHVHGGCYVLSPGEAGTPEAILMAGFGHVKVISVDYRMPPEAYFPAALDDAMTVWKAAVKMADPKNITTVRLNEG